MAGCTLFKQSEDTALGRCGAGLIPIVHSVAPARQLGVLLGLRALLGLSQSVIMGATSATASRHGPDEWGRGAAVHCATAAGRAASKWG